MLSGVPRVAAMDAADMERTVSAFVAAAVRAVEAGFDAVEVHLGHGYLLSQWLSAATNRRTDDHGGSAAARRRFPLRVVEAVREALGGRAALLVKFNLRDGFAGGVELDESIETARALEAAGVDALVPSVGFVSRNAFYLLRGGRPLGAMISAEKLWTQKAALALFGPVLVRPWPWSDLFFFDDAVKLRAAVRLPIVLLAGITHREHLDRAHAAGFEFVAMGRALIADPDLVNQMIAGTAAGSRCNHCNRCVAEMDRGGVRCVLGA
jgi:2,4-dienoyl-CoA reductase-like NADH-dependent reductase (Old Yellow Enzyme family)